MNIYVSNTNMFKTYCAAKINYEDIKENLLTQYIQEKGLEIFDRTAISNTSEFKDLYKNHVKSMLEEDKKQKYVLREQKKLQKIEGQIEIKKTEYIQGIQKCIKATPLTKVVDKNIFTIDLKCQKTEITTTKKIKTTSSTFTKHKLTSFIYLGKQVSSIILKEIYCISQTDQTNHLNNKNQIILLLGSNKYIAINCNSQFIEKSHIDKKEEVIQIEQIQGKELLTNVYMQINLKDNKLLIYEDNELKGKQLEIEDITGEEWEHVYVGYSKNPDALDFYTQDTYLESFTADKNEEAKKQPTGKGKYYIILGAAFFATAGCIIWSRLNKKNQKQTQTTSSQFDN